LPTDRAFSYLQQEEERVKRMAMISYQIENNNRDILTNIQSHREGPRQEKQEEQKKDFEEYFREQLQEI